MSDQNDNDSTQDHDMRQEEDEEEGRLIHAPGSGNSEPVQMASTGSLVDEDIYSELTVPLLEHSSSSCDSGSNEDIQEIVIISSWQGPLLLLAASFLFATLNISLRAIYTQPGPPSPSALSMTRGWLTMGLFLPLVIHKQCQKGHGHPHHGDIHKTQFWKNLYGLWRPSWPFGIL